MTEAVSCGGVVIYRGKILVLYKNYRNRYEGWVLLKGTMEEGETQEETALREVLEESGAKARVVCYLGSTEYEFHGGGDTIHKRVHWYLMRSESYYSKPQKEEYFEDSGYYKFHEAIHLLKFPNEKAILEKAHAEYLKRRKDHTWSS